MFATLANLVPLDRDLPERTHTIDVLGRVLDGTIYDVLSRSFHEERDSESADAQYVPIRRRRPSVRYNLCRLVVEDSVSLLFGEGRFPSIDCQDRATRDTLAEIIKATHLPAAMECAAIKGSVGSVAVLMRVLSGRLFFDMMDTRFLTPVYDPGAPDTLLSVIERYKVRGDVLRSRGYPIVGDDLSAMFWFQRVWDLTTETWFLPWKLQDAAPSIVEDTQRSVVHGLGFVPMVWIRNLPGGEAPDGGCTFRPAVETQIEIDYQLSQAGRGLKYSSDPLLLIREPAAPDGEIIRGGGNALVVSEKGDAKLLEISGTASAAVIEYVRCLRELALESIHGNRSNADKLSAAQSGRALEMLHQPLLWLADRLRTSYGENGLLPLLRMVVAASRLMPLRVAGKTVRNLSDEPLSLRWGPWFSATERDKQEQATTLGELRQSGHMSRETAVKTIAGNYDIEDVPAEIVKIEADETAADARDAAQPAVQTKVSETPPG